MTPNLYLAKHLNGDVIQSLINGAQAAIQEPLPLIQYWTTLSITTAQDVDGTLNYVGALVGYARPLVSNIFILAYPFLMYSLPTTDSATMGFSDTATPLIGGQLDTALPISNNYMPEIWYREVLPIYAQALYYGLSIRVIDLLASWADTNGGGTGYRISRDGYNNLAVIFTTYTDVRLVYICNAVVALLETLPLVTFQEP